MDSTRPSRASINIEETNHDKSEHNTDSRLKYTFFQKPKPQIHEKPRQNPLRGYLFSSPNKKLVHVPIPTSSLGRSESPLLTRCSRQNSQKNNKQVNITQPKRRDISIDSLRLCLGFRRPSADIRHSNSIQKNNMTQYILSEQPSHAKLNLSMSKFLTKYDFSCSSGKKLTKSIDQQATETKLKQYITTNPSTLQ